LTGIGRAVILYVVYFRSNNLQYFSLASSICLSKQE